MIIINAGVQFGAEARDISFPCNTTPDCGDPVHCTCDPVLKLCICHGAQKGSIAEAFNVGHN